MKSQGKPGSSHQVGTPLLVAFLAATVVLSSWLAWEAVEAARSHREVAEEVLADYAAVAASESLRLVRDGMYDFLDDLFDDAPRFTRRETLPGPEAVAWEVDRALPRDCPCSGLRDPLLVFRHDVEEDRVVVGEGRRYRERGDGEPDVPLGAASVVEALHAHRIAAGEEVRYYGLTLLPDDGAGSRALLYGVTRGPEGEVRAVYGYLVLSEALGELVGHWLDETSLLPRSVMGDTPQESLLQVEVSGPRGELVRPEGGDGDGSSPYVTRSRLPPELGGLTMDVAIRPEAADQLIIGGLPRSRLPLLLGLLLVTMGVGGAGLVELRRSHELARLREDFVSSVSHELRTPLTQIRMLAELLEEEKLPTPEERARSTRIIRREAQRLTMLVENVLQFARSRAAPPGVAGEAPEAEVDEVVQEAVALLEAVISKGEATVAVEVEEGSAPRALIHREALRRIVGNLLDNALKYGPAGQTVGVAVENGTSEIRIVVDDEGPGVPPEERDSVWEPYRRLPREVEARRPGSGLGLAVVRELVQRYDGSVELGESPAGGARFTVRLPAAPAKEA